MSWLDMPARCSVFGNCVTWGEFLLYSALAAAACIAIRWAWDKWL